MRFKVILVASACLAFLSPEENTKELVSPTGKPMLKKFFETFRGEPGAVIKLLENGSNIPSTLEENVVLGLLLDRFVGQLKTFINEVQFQYAAFEEYSQAIEQEFWNIIIFYSFFRVSPSSSLQLKHALVILSTMVDATEHMVQSKYFNNPHHRVASDLFELHLLGLTFLDRFGLPQAHTKDHLLKVSRLKGRLHNLKARMDFLPPAPKDLNTVLESQYSQSLNVIKLLSQ